MSRAKGYEAEAIASRYLIHKDFRVIEQNFYTKYGEIDIIAFKENTLYFVEVKSGSGFDPIDNVTPEKIEKLKKSIAVFLKTKALDLPYNLSLIIIKNNDLEFIENITV